MAGVNVWKIENFTNVLNIEKHTTMQWQCWWLDVLVDRLCCCSTADAH